MVSNTLFSRLLSATALAGALTLVMPPAPSLDHVTFEGLGPAEAQAKNGRSESGGGNGNGGGNGGGNGRSERAGGEGGDRGKGSGGRSASFGDVVDEMTGARHAKERARGRYAEASGSGEADAGAGEVAGEVDAEAVNDLVERGWSGKRAQAIEEGFANHGQRVKTMVEVAKELGYGAHVGALQANFGATPSEPVDTSEIDAEIEAMQTDLEEAKAALEEDPENQELIDQVADLEASVDAKEAEKEAAIEEASAWDGDWRTADLDVNDDGIVDERDIEAARAAEEAEADPEADPEEVAAEEETTPEEAPADPV